MNAPELVEKLSRLPGEVTDSEYLVITPKQTEKIFTLKRKKIIELLFNQNPLTEEKISHLLDFDAHKDLVFLRHLKLIDIKDNVVTLNRKIKVSLTG